MKVIVVIFWLCVVPVLLTWNLVTFYRTDLPPGTLTSNEGVVVKEGEEMITFEPVANRREVAIIFLQSGLADPKSYAPLCRKLSESGYVVNLMKMPWRLPQFHCTRLMRLFDFDKKKYVIGGHGQGASAASQFVKDHPNLLRGLFILGAKGTRNIDLSASNISCIKIYAEQDDINESNESLPTENRLPDATRLVLIKGGNYSQFGYLGNRYGDLTPEISLEDQQATVATEMISFLDSL
ncbi:MAG: alpha/beta hydrolase [Chryseolinea sp.]